MTVSEDTDNPLPAGVTIDSTANSASVTIRDDDPTIVSLARTGSGAVTEGAKVEFTVTLGRALIAGETIDVPLSIGGTSVTTGDWSLALKSSATNTGVTLSDAGTTTPEVSFTNAGAQTATLELTATADGTAENTETFEIALGANSAFDDTSLDTNVGGGADPHGTNNDFDVTVNNANNAPTVANAIPNRTATVGTAFSYTFPANTFSDANNDSLTYTATKSDDTALPSWLTFTAVTRTFSGTPQAANVGTLSVKVTANDGNSGTVSDTFDIVVSAAANNAPRVANAIPNQTATAGTAFSFQFPANTFSDADSDSLTYTATKSDGTALPTWLTFTAVTRTFSGTPQSGDTGTLSVKVTADDGNSGSVSDTFDLVVSNAGTTTPTITIAGGSAVTEGTAASFTLTASPAPSANLDVRVDVTQSGSFVANGDRGTKTVTIASGQTSKTFTVPTQGDSTDEPNGSVTATVDTGTGYTVGSASSATVTIRDDDTAQVGPTPFISLSLTSGDGRCTDSEGTVRTGPEYDCVRATSVDETDSTPVNVEFYVRTSQLSSSALPFRVCFTGTATPPTGDRAEQDYLVQERVGSAWKTRNSTCVDSSIAANQHHRKFRIQVLGDDHYERIPMLVNGEEQLVISGTEWVGVQLYETPGKKLPSPYEINSARVSLGVTINDDDYGQQPLAFGTWTGKPDVREGRPSPGRGKVGIPFSAKVGWETVVTYRIVRGHEAGGGTAIYGTDYRLRGDYNQSTNRGTMTLAKGKTLASLPITVIEDTLIEDTETVVLEMVDTGAREVGSPNRITIYIRDDEATPLLKVDELGTVLRDGVDSGHRIKMSLTPAHSSIPDRTLPVDAHFEYCVTSSATLGDDYTLVRPDGTKVTTTGCHLATLPKGELSTYLDLKLFDDGSSDEPDESVKIWLQRSTVAGKETTDLLEIPDSTRTADETISTVITIKDDLPVLAVSGVDDTSRRDRRFRAKYTIRSVNGALPTDLYVKWQVEDTGNVVDDNRKSGYKTLVRGFSEFTVTIGLRHDAGPGTVTFKLTPAGRPFRLTTDSKCVRINNGQCPVGNNAPAVQVPDTAVSNLQVTAVDDASASVSWDAVAHATSYEMSWDGSGSQTAVSGIESVTGTTATIRHEAEEAMTLTVTVTPEHLDGNGVVQQLAALAATATLAVGQGSPEQAEEPEAQTPACVSDALLADVEEYAGETWRTSPGHVERWSRVLAAFGVSNAYSSNPMTVAEAQAQADRGLQRWAPVAPALQCLAAAPEEEAEQAEVQPATPATPVLSLSAGSAVDEGGNAGFTVTADPAPQSDLTIAWTVAQSGDYLDAPGAGHRTATLAAGTTSTDLSVATVDDATNEADGSVSVTLGTGTGYTVATGKGSATVAVRDDDAPVVRIAAGSGVTEGSAASFTVSASPVPAAPLDVTLSVGQSGDFAASGATGARTVTVPVTGSMTFEVATVDDGADEPDGSIAATLGTGTGYTVAAAPDNAATVAVSDNDAAASGPTISIADASFTENERYGYFTVTLSEKTDHDVRFAYATRDSTPVSATANADYVEIPRAWRIGSRIKAGKTQARFWIPIRNDSHDEDPETFEVELFDAFVWRSGKKVSVSIADGVAVGTITNSDPMPAAWLARFGRTAAEQALDGIAGRIAASRSAGMEGTLAGRSLSFAPGAQSSGAATGATPGTSSGNDPLAHSAITGAFGDDGFGRRATPVQTLTMREALLGSHFTATGEADASGGSVALWGRAAQSRFDGREGSFSLDGEATTAMLGADYARGNWLVGTALMQSAGEGGYADTDVTPRPASQTCPEGVEDVVCSGAVREGDGAVEASLTAAVPYAALEASERLKVWGAAGYGSGEVTLKPAMGGALTSDITWTMAAAGARSALLGPPGEGSGLALALTSDALWARTSSDKTHELAASDSDVTRLRLGLEGRWRNALEGGGHFTPKLEAGMRHDGGDAETGFGIELGGGLAWSAPGLGLNLDVSGRTLLAHGDDDLKDRGFAASMAFDPDPGSERGPSLSLGQSYGAQAQGGLDALFAVDPLADRTGNDAQSRWTAEAAWGFAAFGGRFTGSPHAGLGLSTGTRDYTLGWRLTPAAGANAPEISFGARATRREHDAASPEHIIGLEAAARW